MQCVENCLDTDPRKRILFEQPVWQTVQMFVGEVRSASLSVHCCLIGRPYHSFNRCYVVLSPGPLIRMPLTCTFPIGLFPVLFNYFQDRHRPPAVQLPVDHTTDSGDDSSLEGKPFERIEMRGWSVFLLWLPAICDLTGTTVCYSREETHLNLTNVRIAHERWTFIHSGLHIPNDPRSTGTLGRSIFRHVLTSETLAIPVRCMLLTVALAINLPLSPPRVDRWLSLVTVMIGVSIVGLSGSLANDAVTDAGPAPGVASSPIGVRDEIPEPATVFIGAQLRFNLDHFWH